MYSCYHCEASCHNRTYFNRHMRQHMTTDIKFLEKQQSDFLELREEFQKQKLDDGNNSIVQEKSEIQIEANIVVEEATVDVTTTAAMVKSEEVDSREISFDSDDMEDIDDMDDLEDTDFLDDEEDYCDLNDILPQETDMTRPTIETQSEKDLAIKNDFKTELSIANTESADEDYEDYDSENSTDFMEDEDDYVERDLVLANLEPRQDTSTDISKNLEPKQDDSTNTNISQILNRYRQVLDTSEPKHDQSGLELNMDYEKEVLKAETETEGSIKVSTVAEETADVDEQGEVAENVMNPAMNKSFPCDGCDKKYKSSRSLKHHNLIHTGEKPHKCEECGESFRLKSQLIKHAKVEHDF